MQAKSRQTNKAGSHQGRDHQGNYNNSMIQHGPNHINQMSQSKSPQKDVRQMTAKSFHNNGSFKGVNMGHGASTGHAISSDQNDGVSYVAANQPRTLIGGVQISAQIQQKQSSQKRQKQQMIQNVGQMHQIGSQNQQIQLVNKNQYGSVKNSSFQKINNPVLDHGNNMYHTQNQMNQIHGFSENMQDYVQNEQPIPGTKASSNSVVSPQQAIHYYQKMSSMEQNQIKTQKHQIMQQPPHFIKMKSKTNNPTRQSSPGIKAPNWNLNHPQKQANPQYISRQTRDQNYSNPHMRDVEGNQGNGIGIKNDVDTSQTPVKINFHGVSPTPYLGKAQLLSQQNSPKKMDAQILDRSGMVQVYVNSQMEEKDKNLKQTLKNNLLVEDKAQKKQSQGLVKNALGVIDMDVNNQLTQSGTAHSLYQKSQKAKNMGLSGNNHMVKQSIDLRLSNFQKVPNKQIKGQSTKDVLNHQTKQQNTQSSIQTNQRLNTSGLNGSNDQLAGRSNDRISNIGNSPGPAIINKSIHGIDSSSHVGAITNTGGTGQQHLNNNQNTKGNKLSQIGQISLEQNVQKHLDPSQQQKKYLNMVVQKKIGGIASGKQRREHRNQMIKTSQQFVNPDNKLGIGSIGSIGSLGPFMGVQEVQYQGHGNDTYDQPMTGNNQNMTMKFPIDTEKVNKTNGHQKISQYQKLSQLQQMHQNNLNPMSLTMTEHFAGNQSKVSQYQQMVNFTNEDQFRTEQHMKTQGSNIQSLATNQLDQSGNRSIKQVQKQILYRQNDQNFRTQLNPSYDNQSLLVGSQGQKSTQNSQKGQVIQMRKVNPISKTAQTESKTASIDMKKKSTNSIQGRIVGNSNIIQQNQQNFNYIGKNQVQSNQKNTYHNQGYGQQVQPPKIMGPQQNDFEVHVYQKTNNQKYGQQKGQKAYSNTTKVSLNNTPKGGKKLMIGQGMHGVTSGRGNNSTLPMQYLVHGSQMANHQQKPQQMLKQQPPIGQPVGDIPVKNENKGEAKNQTQQQFQVNEFSVDGNTDQSQGPGSVKKHQYAQSMHIEEEKLQTQSQNMGHHAYSKSIVQQIGSPQINLIVQQHDQDSDSKQRIVTKPQSNSSMGGKSTQNQLSKASGIVHGKIKLRVVSENSSPPTELGGFFSTQIHGSTFNQTQNFHTQNYNRSGQKANNVSTTGSNNRSNSKGKQMNSSQMRSNFQDKKQHKNSMHSTGQHSKISTGGSNMAIGANVHFNSPPNAISSAVHRKSLHTNESNNLRRSSAAPSSSSNTLKNSNRTGNKIGGTSVDPMKKSQLQNGKNSSNSKNEMSQQYINQYFKQQKNIVGQVMQGNESTNTADNQRSDGDTNQQVFAFAKYSQIDSPKDSSIERARQNDMLQQEAAQDSKVLQMNQQLKNVITIDLPEFVPHHTNQDPSGSQLAERNKEQANQNQHYILSNIEKHQKNPQALSARSKEVYLIRQLITDCFRKYEKPPKTQLELYKIGKMLGKGAFGKVNLGLHRLTRKLCAIKSINMDFMKEESQKKKIMNEINILKSLRHPNNIKILETFQTEKHHMIVMELCPGGDLLNYVRKRRKLNEQYAKFVFKQIMEGISYLHENRVSHRDIKLDNILLDGHGNIKIGDFGVSRKIDEQEILFEQCGTPAYIAPEIVKDMGYKGFPVDIWSAGICLYAMLGIVESGH